MAQTGVEIFIITPLECFAPASANAQEHFWMLKWGTARLFNIDVPFVSSRRWDFLNTRKVWKREPHTQGGPVLGYAKEILTMHTLLRPNDTRHPYYCLCSRALRVF